MNMFVLYMCFSLQLTLSAELIFYRLGETTPVTPTPFPVPSELERMSVREVALMVDPQTPRCLIFTSKGIEVKRSLELAKGGTYVLVPTGKLWVWTALQKGEKIVFDESDVSSAIRGHPVALESISQNPRVFYLHNIINEEESSSLIELAEDTFKHPDDCRDDPHADVVVVADLDATKGIVDRVCTLLRVSCDNRAVDGIAIFRYLPGQMDPEEDYFDYTSPTQYVTVLIDLSDVPAGGQTMFPKVGSMSAPEIKMLSRPLRPILSPQSEGDNTVDEALLARNLGRNRGAEFAIMKLCHTKLTVRPKKHGAILYYNTDSSYVPDPIGFHATCPVCNGTKWAAKVKIWTGPKQATGAPITIQATFTNTMGQPMEVKWKYQNERKLLVTVQPGETSQHTTFDNHEFEFYILGQLVDGLVISSRNGLEQNVNIPTTGPQPISTEIQVIFINNFPVALDVAWINGDEEIFLNEIAAGGHSIQRTVHAHVFEFTTRAEDGEERRVLQSHVMDGSLGPRQEVVLGSEEEEELPDDSDMVVLEDEKIVHYEL